MKFSLIIGAFTVFIATVYTNDLTEDYGVISSTSNKKNILSRENSELSHMTRTNETLNSTPRSLFAKNRQMPKIEIELKGAKNAALSFVVTTRRPLMKNKKFTTKPHAVHYAHYQTSAEQVNFSKGKSNAKRRFQPQTTTKNNGNNNKHIGSTEDRFRDFTDVSDVSELGQNKRRTSVRGHYLRAAGSVNVKRVVPYTISNANHFRSRTKLAIEQSLQKIKTIRTGMNDPINEEFFSSIKTHRLQNSTPRYTDLNEANTSRTTHNLVDSATIMENLVPLVTNTDKPIQSAMTVKENNVSPISTVNLNNSQTKLQNSDRAYVMSENLVNSETKTVHSHYPVLHKSSDKILNKPKSSIRFAVTTNNASDSLNTMDEKAEVITTSTISSLVEENNSDRVTNTRKYNTTTTVVAPAANGNEIISIESTTHHLETKHKRHINIIEEERVATTITGLKFNGHEKPFGADSTYRNIHT